MVQEECQLFVKRLSKTAILPNRGSEGAAGYDLYWCNVLTSSKETIIDPRNKAIVPTDISIALPTGTYGRIAPRSGLAVKHFLDVGAGVIDRDYRGPLGIVIFNFSDVQYKGYFK